MESLTTIKAYKEVEGHLSPSFPCPNYPSRGHRPPILWRLEWQASPKVHDRCSISGLVYVSEKTKDNLVSSRATHLAVLSHHHDLIISNSSNQFSILPDSIA